MQFSQVAEERRNVPDSDPREFGLNSKKQAFSIARFFCNLAEFKQCNFLNFIS
jgi:hypothetical protein